jgi:GGDEF domain-containing protein
MVEKQMGQAAEKERRVKEVFDALIDGRAKEQTDRAEHPAAWLEARLEGLPNRARKEVIDYNLSLEADGITDTGRREWYVEAKINTFEQTYQDRRFTVGEDERMLKQEYAKEQALEWLNQALGAEPEVEDLKKIALLNFDANGLKAVNDLSGSHEKGTEYLRRIAEIFHDEESGAAAWLKSRGITDLLAVTGGGDEYSVMIRSERPIAQETLDEAVRMYESAISGLNVADLVDFSDQETRLRFLGLSEAHFESLSDSDRAKKMKETGDMPAGFMMRASAAGGGRTMHDGLLSALEHSTKPITASDSFPRATMKIVGGLWDAADAKAVKQKLDFKKSLSLETASPGDRFYAKVLARTSEARILEAQVEALQSEVRAQKAIETEHRELDDLLDSGAIDEVTYARAMRKVNEKYRPKK